MAAKTRLLKLSSYNLAFFLLMKAIKTFRTRQKPSRNSAAKSVTKKSLTPSDAAGLASEPARLSAQRAQIKAFQPLTHQRRRGSQPSLSPGECSLRLRSCPADVLLTTISSGLICIRGDSLIHALELKDASAIRV